MYDLLTFNSRIDYYIVDISGWLWIKWGYDQLTRFQKLVFWWEVDILISSDEFVVISGGHTFLWSNNNLIFLSWIWSINTIESLEVRSSLDSQSQLIEPENGLMFWFAFCRLGNWGVANLKDFKFINWKKSLRSISLL